MASNKAVTFNDTTYNPATGDVPKYNSGTGLWIPSGLSQNVGTVFADTQLGPAGDIDFALIPTSIRNIYSFTGHIICVVNKKNAGAWDAGNFCTWNIANGTASYGPIGVDVTALDAKVTYPTAWSESTASQLPNFNPFSGAPGNRFASTFAFIKGKTNSLQFSVRIPINGFTANSEFRTSIVLMMTTSPYVG